VTVVDPVLPLLPIADPSSDIGVRTKGSQPARTGISPRLSTRSEMIKFLMVCFFIIDSPKR